MLLLYWRWCFLVAIGESTGVGSEADLEGLCVPTVFLYVPTRVTQTRKAQGLHRQHL